MTTKDAILAALEDAEYALENIADGHYPEAMANLDDLRETLKGLIDEPTSDPK